MIYLTGARLVLADTMDNGGAVLIEDGVIAAIDPESAPRSATEVALDGQLLMPGLIDVHCDALEKDIEPRPNVRFPFALAIAQADKRNAAAGITTAFHALSFAQGEIGVRDVDVAEAVVRAVHDYRPHGLIDNRVHCRWEVTDPAGLASVLAVIEAGQAHLISLMDHTPGRGQFKDEAAFRAYFAAAYGKSTAELDAILRAKYDNADRAGAGMGAIAAAAKAHGVPLASHDDDSPERVAMMAALGAALSEFPIDLATARAAEDHGMATLFGAPNLVRGASQSGAVRALDAVRAGLARCLCSDYAPAMLPAALFGLAEAGTLTWPEAAALAADHPARAVGLADRGVIAPGLRADLAAWRISGDWPQVTRCWVAGREVLRLRYPQANGS
ncbi:MAG: alpha-D-ribose 1-methylphosphonate 5-triphosphate diphosphatase [Alphaproteobacteria bacterium]|jgi:alpha-D-ribose 1-methylphosphonate 5-triphosphate diphosphatase|nr:alpha-D-ribose 1-methylphosphonate 5-triphosphate diphosphatase [Alphaproteobacteria bacterium]MDP6515420.1 alpha-D-ribose 1-methylphosphonate 5-triphosphate diphosphatase [Alphaproteobacteria bacterium]